MRKQLFCWMTMSLFFALATGALMLSASLPANGQDTRPWRVWQKDNPCSGRTDWVSVAQENPGGRGGMVYFEVFPGSHSWATKAEAEAEAGTARLSPRFAQYCCRDYSVWQNQQTNKLTVVVGKYPGNPGPGWFFKKGDLCCEDAFAMAGIAGYCDQPHGGDGNGCGMGYKWEERESVDWTSVWTRRGNSNVFDAAYTGPGGQRAGTTNTVTIEGNRVYIKRTASSNNDLCSYTGTIGSDGVSITGTYTCSGGGIRAWTARIICSATTPKDPKPPLSDTDFSGTWTWVRGGSYECKFRYTLSLSRKGATEWQGTLNIRNETAAPCYDKNENHAIRLVQGQYPGSAEVFQDGADTGNRIIKSKDGTLSWEGLGSFKQN